MHARADAEDQALVDCWCRAHGTYVPPDPDNRARLLARLSAIRTRHTAAAQYRRGAPA
jgi:hypothetical protein